MKSSETANPPLNKSMFQRPDLKINIAKILFFSLPYIRPIFRPLQIRPIRKKMDGKFVPCGKKSIPDWSHSI
jgi:hypothetical protein